MPKPDKPFQEIPDLTIRHLYYFYESVRLGSINQASKELNVSSHTMRAAIRNLEKKFNTTFFQKNREKISLTKKGKEFFEYSRRTLNLFHTSFHNINSESNANIIRDFTIITTTTISEYYLPEILLETGEKFGVKINILSGPSYFQDILKRDFDLIIGPSTNYSDLTKRTVMHSKYYLYCAPEQAEVFRKHKSTKNLKGENLLLFSGTHFLDETFVKKNNVVLTSNSFGLLAKMCSLGYGLLSCVDSYNQQNPDIARLENLGVTEEQYGYAYYDPHSYKLEISEFIVSRLKERFYEKN